MAGLMIQTLSRELFSVADEHDGKLPAGWCFSVTSWAPCPPSTSCPCFQPVAPRRLTLVPIIQSLAQLEKNYGKEGGGDPDG